MERPTKRAKRFGEMTDAEQEAVRMYCWGAHPSNIPDDFKNAWWEIDPKTGKAGWIAGYVL